MAQVVAIDFDGTLTADPGFYRAQCRGLMDAGWQVHVLTGNPDAHHLLGKLGMVKGRDYSHVAVVPKKHIARFKVAYMRQVGSTQLIDNRLKNVKAAAKAGFTGHWALHPQEKSYEPAVTITEARALIDDPSVTALRLTPLAMTELANDFLTSGPVTWKSLHLSGVVGDEWSTGTLYRNDGSAVNLVLADVDEVVR